MKYIIMCGGQFKQWKQQIPRHLTKIQGQTVLERTIRLLKKYGIQDICISTNNPIIKQFCESKMPNFPILQHYNQYTILSYNNCEKGEWYNGFYPMDEPVCYIFGDVVFSQDAIKTIVNEQVEDIQFFASSPPFNELFFKDSAQPFAFKVNNTKHFKESLEIIEWLNKRGYFKRHPIAWQLWQVIKGTPLNHIDYTNYCTINDYTCDIDYPEDAVSFNEILGTGESSND